MSDWHLIVIFRQGLIWTLAVPNRYASLLIGEASRLNPFFMGGINDKYWILSMSAPQTENGYTRIANELLDAIIQFDFSKRQYAVVFSVIRMTYGFNKKSDALSIWQIANMTNIDRSHVSKAVAELVSMNVLIKSESGRIAHGQIVPEISLNKMYKNWITDAEMAQVNTDAETAPAPKQHLCQNSPQTDAETATPPVPKQHTHKDIPKDIPKDSKNNIAHSDRKQSFFPADFPAQLQADFEQLRKAKRAPITQTAIDGLTEEAGKANITLEAAIKICCQQGWQGFKASWLDNLKAQESKHSSAQRKPAPDNFKSRDYGQGGRL